MNIYTIYKSTNIITGKVYIGFDSNWPKRKQKHKTKYKKLNLLFYDAIKKYGWDNFHWEIIYQSLDGPHTLNVMENHFINEYRSFYGFSDCNGYNMTLGGEGVLGLSGEKSPWFNRKHSEHTKKILSEKLKGKSHKVSDSTKQKLRSYMIGRIPTESERKKISIANSKIYFFYNPQNVKIKITNLKKFCEENNLSYGCMRQLMYKRAKQHKGWKYYL